MTFAVDEFYFRQRVKLLLRGLISRFDELSPRDFPSEVPGDVIKITKAVLVGIEEKLETADEKLLVLIFQLLGHYQKLLPFLDHAHTEQTPRGLAYVLRNLLMRLSPNAAFFASPQADYNYTIRDFKPLILRPVANLLSAAELSALPGVAISQIHMVSFPRAERDSILLHAVFGHEVGHLVASNYLNQEATTTDFRAGLQSAMSIADASVPTDPNVPKIKRLQQIQTQLLALRKRALEELISDYVGALLFGPSALFAGYEIFSLSDLDWMPSPPALYPPSRYRLRFVTAVLKEEGFFTSWDKLRKESNHPGIASASDLLTRIETIVGSDEDLKVIRSDALVKTAYDWVEQSLPAAKQGVKNLLPADMVYRAEALEAQLIESLERLELKIPPDGLGVFPEIRLPAWQSALVTGWICRIHAKMPESRGGADYTVADFDTINQLCLRAIENISLQSDFIDHLKNK